MSRPDTETWFEHTHGIVERTKELDRVLALPFAPQPWTQAECETLTRYLGGRGDFVFWSHQAAALCALSDLGGAFCVVPVGGGKTAISYVAARVIGAKRPVLLIPAKLGKKGDKPGKTQRDFAKLAKIFGKIDIEIVHYELLSRRADLLERLNPDLIVADECHKLRSLGSGCTKRFIRYLRQHECHVVCMSGTITQRSLLDFWHLLAATVGTKRMPLPKPRAEIVRWANAVDEKVDVRARHGALELFCKTANPNLNEVREALGRHITTREGVVHVPKADCASSIQIETLKIPVGSEARRVLGKLQRRKIGPDGEECTQEEIWRHRRTLSLEFAYVWEPPPPAAWLKARKGWNRVVRRILEAGDPRYDTEMDVARGAARGDLPDEKYKAWVAIRKTFRPNSVPIWYGTSVLEEIARLSDEPGTLVWVEHGATGDKLSEITGWPYYRNYGMCGKRYVEDHDSDCPAIVSIESNLEGRELQFKFHRSIITTTPTTGEAMEQLLGRTHRPGQCEDTVYVLILTSDQDPDLVQAVSDAEYIQATTRSPQKILMADWL